jgi:hypothetical protein
MKILKKYFFVILGFFVGVLFFFPLNQIKDAISSNVAQSTGIILDIQRLEPTLGLRLGLGKGAFIGLSAIGAHIRFPQGSLNCDELIIAPRVWPILMGQLQLGVGCLEKERVSLVALVKASPFWAPSAVDLSVDFKEFSLENIDLQSDLQNELKGIVSGTLEAQNVSLTNIGSPSVLLDVQGSEVRTPSTYVMGVTLSSLDLDTVKIVGSLGKNSLKIPTLNFGNTDSPIQGKLSFESDFPMPRMIPQKGQLRGMLKVTPAGIVIFKNVFSLSLVFGPADTTGTRQINKKFTNDIKELLGAYQSNN